MSDNITPNTDPTNVTPNDVTSNDGAPAQAASPTTSQDTPSQDTETLNTLKPILDPAELTQLIRLNAALTEGDLTDLELEHLRTEDPELTDLLNTANTIQRAFHTTTTTHAFNSFHHRSRSAILHTLEQEQPTPLRERLRVIVAAAAGLAAITLAAATYGAPALDAVRNTSDTASNITVSTPNLTQRTGQEQLQALGQTVAALRHSASTGQPLTTDQLNTLTGTTARIADTIDRGTEPVTEQDVRTYLQTAETARQALSTARTAPGAEDAAVAAARTIEDGITVATRYLGTTDPTPTTTPEPTPTATPDPTPTEQPDDKDEDTDETETAEPTPTATATANATADPTPPPTQD